MAGQQYQEGQHLQGSDGNIYVVQGGVPVRADVGGAGPQVVVPVSPLETNKTVAETGKTTVDTVRTQQEIAQTAAMAADQQRKMKAEADKASAEARLAQQGTTPEQRNNVLGSYRAIDNLQRGINDIVDQYKAGPGATSGVGGLSDYLPLTSNERFNNAGNRVRGFVGSALGLTASQNNTEKESARNIGGYIPSSWDRDAVVLDKIRALQALVDEARASAKTQLGQGAPPAGIEPSGNVRAMLGTSSPGAPPAPPSGSATPGAPAGTPPGGIGPATLATGATKDRPDDQANTLINGLYRSGATEAQINSALQAIGRPPLAAGFYDKAKRQHASAVGGYTISEPTTSWNRISASPGASTALGAIDGASAGLFDEGAGAINSLVSGAPLNESIADMNARKQAMATTNPWSYGVGNIAGNIGGQFVGGAALKGIGLAGAAGRFSPLVGDAAFGALSGAGESNDDRLSGAALGAGAALAGRGMFAGAAKAGGKVLSGVQASAPVQALRNAGIPLTVGQAVGQNGVLGRSIKNIEDHLSGIPIVGNVIKDRRLEGLTAFNGAAFDHGLSPIKGSTNGVIGERGIDAAQDVVDQGYTKALDGVQVTPDQQFVQDAAKTLAAGKAIPVAGPQFEHIVNTRVAPIFDSSANGTITGPKLQGALQGLRRANLGTDAMSVDGNSALRDLSGNIEDLVDRQAPDVMPAYQNANKAFRNEEILRDSVNRARNTNGVFTAAQLADAAAANSRRFGNTQGTTRQPFFDLTRAGQEVLPSKVPDSGTAGKLATLALPSLLGGSGGVAAGVASEDSGTGTGTGIGLAAMLALAGTKKGQQALVKGLFNRNPLSITAGRRIAAAAPALGMFGRGLGSGVADTYLLGN